MSRFVPFDLSMTPDEAFTLSRDVVTVAELKYAEYLYFALMQKCADFYKDPGNMRFYQCVSLAAIWNAGRVYGIRSERQRRRSRV